MSAAVTLAIALLSSTPANPTATFTTSMGTFVAEIYLDRVPRTSSNFVDLVKAGFYDGLHFHRVMYARRGEMM